MKIWNRQKPWYRTISMILVFSMTLSLLSGCADRRVETQTGATQTDASVMDVETELPEIETAEEIPAIVSDVVSEEIYLCQEALVSAAGEEEKVLEELSDAVADGDLETAKELFAELSESISAADTATDSWIAAQDQAVEEIMADPEVSEEAKTLLSERAESLKEVLTESKENTETVITALEQAITEGNTEEAKVKAEELKTMIHPSSAPQTYGTGNYAEAVPAGDASLDTLIWQDAVVSQETRLSEENTDLLALSGDTDINYDVMDIADELGTPLEIYNYLKNTIGFEYYYGSRKGANGTYAAYAGNDYDQASLFIGMLRYLGYEAEYVRGNILLDEEMALSLTGADTFEHAADVLAAAGVPVTRLRKDGEVAYIRMEHVWVRALLPYSDYRGAGEADGEMVWLDLDTSIKEYESVDNIYDIAADMGIPDGLSEAAERGDMDTVQTLLEEYKDEVSELDLDEVYARKRIIRQEELSYLPASLQYKVEEELDVFSEISTSDKDSIRFEVAGENLGTYTASELAGKTVLLTFLPASEADAEILNAYDTIFDVPAAYLYLKPALLIDGEVAAEAEYVEQTLGTTSSFTMTLNYTGDVTQKTKTVENSITAGSMYAITIDNQTITGDELQGIYSEVTALIGSVNERNVYSTDYLGRYLSLAGKLYFAEVDTFAIEAAEVYNVSVTRRLSEGITGYEVQKVSRYGVVTGISFGSLYIDVDSDDHSAVSLSNEVDDSKAYMMSAGVMSSFYESTVWEQLTGYESVSTIAIFQKAKEQDIEILQITQDNLEEQLKKLNTDDETKQDVREAVNSGKPVAIPMEEVTIGEWTGTGYIILDETTGAASYMISGGLNGGEVPILLQLQVLMSSFMSATASKLLIEVLSSSILASAFPLATAVACISIALIMTTLILDMYVSYYDYIINGDMDSYLHTEEMVMLLYFATEIELALSQLIYAYFVLPYLNDESEEGGSGDAETGGNTGEGSTASKVQPSKPYDPDAKPRGTPAKINDNMEESMKRSLTRENEAAETLAQHGYDIEQNPVVEGTTKNPDYRIEGEIFDCYAPEANTVERSIWTAVKKKVKNGQANRIVLNLDDWAGDINELIKQFENYFINGLVEVLGVKGGNVFPIY